MTKKNPPKYQPLENSEDKNNSETFFYTRPPTEEKEKETQGMLMLRRKNVKTDDKNKDKGEIKIVAVEILSGDNPANSRDNNSTVSEDNESVLKNELLPSSEDNDYDINSRPPSPITQISNTDNNTSSFSLSGDQGVNNVNNYPQFSFPVDHNSEQGHDEKEEKGEETAEQEKMISTLQYTAYSIGEQRRKLEETLNQHNEHNKRLEQQLAELKNELNQVQEQKHEEKNSEVKELKEKSEKLEQENAKANLHNREQQQKARKPAPPPASSPSTPRSTKSSGSVVDYQPDIKKLNKLLEEIERAKIFRLHIYGNESIEELDSRLKRYKKDRDKIQSNSNQQSSLWTGKGFFRGIKNTLKPSTEKKFFKVAGYTILAILTFMFVFLPVLAIAGSIIFTGSATSAISFAGGLYTYGTFQVTAAVALGVGTILSIANIIMDEYDSKDRVKQKTSHLDDEITAVTAIIKLKKTICKEANEILSDEEKVNTDYNVFNLKEQIRNYRDSLRELADKQSSNYQDMMRLNNEELPRIDTLSSTSQQHGRGAPNNPS